jgi:ferrous iron transport protein A
MAATLPRYPAFIPITVESPSGTALRRAPDIGVQARAAAVTGSGGGTPRAALDPAAVPLTTLRRGDTGRVAGVRVGGDHDAALERMALRLIEIGFVEGEHLRVVAFGQPGDDPIGVRIGGRGGVSSFALRRVEAGCVWVVPEPAGQV